VFLVFVVFPVCPCHYCFIIPTEHVTTFVNERLVMRKAHKKRKRGRFFQVMVCGRISHLWSTNDRGSGYVSFVIIGHAVFL
jgi:hypothetical protein